MRQIGREFEGEKGVVQVQIRADVLTQGRVQRQLHQPPVVFGEFEFTGRTQHALTFHATQFAQLDFEGLTVLTRRQFSAHQGARNANAHARVGGATNNVQQLRLTRRVGLAHIHLADTQAVGVGVLHRFFDFAHHNVAERRSHRLHLFHFQTRHGQGVGKLLSGQGRVAKLAQPRFWELHGFYLLKLRQKTNVTVKEQAQVVHAVAQHGQAVGAHAEGKADVFFGVQAHVAHHIRVHLA